MLHINSICFNRVRIQNIKILFQQEVKELVTTINTSKQGPPKDNKERINFISGPLHPYYLHCSSSTQAGNLSTFLLFFSFFLPSSFFLFSNLQLSFHLSLTTPLTYLSFPVLLYANLQLYLLSLSFPCHSHFFFPRCLTLSLLFYLFTLHTYPLSDTNQSNIWQCCLGLSSDPKTAAKIS